MLRFNVSYNTNISLIMELNRVKVYGDSVFNKSEICAYAIIPIFDLKETVPCGNVFSGEIVMN